MKVSVIIPTYNEENTILECLSSLDTQRLKDFEVIVIDDGSTDKTLEKVKAYKPTSYKVKVLKQGHEGPAMARNYGARTSAGEILVFVDADMTFARNFLRELTLPIRNRKAKGTYSDSEYVANWQNIWARCWNFNQGISDKRRHKSTKRSTLSNIYDYIAFITTSRSLSKRQFLESRDDNITTVFRAIKKSDFTRVGGYDKGGYTDDYSLGKKLAIKATRTSEAHFYHNNPDSLYDVFKQAKWSAKRSYRLGIIGDIYTVIKSLFPISLSIAIYKSLLYRTPRFIIFKLVYDTAVILGIIEYRVLGKGTK